MNEFIAYLVKNLVEKPSEVAVEVIDKGQTMLVEIRVASGDIARLVGRQGRTINALRVIAMTIGARFDRKIRLELIDDRARQELASSTIENKPQESDYSS